MSLGVKGNGKLKEKNEGKPQKSATFFAPACPPLYKEESGRQAVKSAQHAKRAFPQKHPAARWQVGGRCWSREAR